MQAVIDEDSDPTEIPVQTQLHIKPYAQEDRTRIVSALLGAAKKHGVTTDEILPSSRMVAVVSLQSGKEFTSEPIPGRLWRKILEIKKQMDGWTDMS
jgi:hypothetical protein